MMFENKYFINNRKCNAITAWVMLLVIFLLIFLNVLFNYEYKNYDKYLGYIKNIDGLKLGVYIKQEDVSNINNYDLIINNLKYDFKIVSISHEFYIIDTYKCYEVILDVALKNDLLIENNLIELVFQKNTTTLYNELKKGIKKWIY